jgi:Na+-transporting NADH:ubiquinone oxidoreductase subunit NqrB
MLLKDTRDYQILFLAAFLILGIGTRDWTLQPGFIGIAIASSILTQCFCTWITQRQADTPLNINIRSPLITSLGLSLLLRSDHWTTMVLASVSAIASKFIFTKLEICSSSGVFSPTSSVREEAEGKGAESNLRSPCPPWVERSRNLLPAPLPLLTSTKKHFFNPANFGIITALIFTSDAWVSPGQWGDEWWYALLFMGAGGLILRRVGRWDTTVAFLGVYASLEAIRNIWLGWTWDVCIHRLMSGSLLLFALFMVTDPRSIPNSRRGRVIWATCIAVVTFILRNYFFIPSAVFWALFALAPFTVIIDTFCQEKQFNWETNSPYSDPRLFQKVGDL